MKVFSIVAFSVGITFVVIQIYLSMSSKKTETQPYKVIQTGKDFEIRFYPAATMATVVSTAKTYKELGNSGFRQLANFIFGGNQDNKQIAMTTPVHMDINDSLSTMSFVMPAAYSKDNLPKPNDAQVKIEATPEEYVAAIEFGGFASDKDIKAYSEKLAQALKDNGIAYFGKFRFLGYNPPFQVLGRKNEVIVQVKWEKQ
jgi:hypothetical protein